MSGAQSISARRAYGVQRVCRVWGRARSSVYVRRHATRSRASRRRHGRGAGRPHPPGARSLTVSWRRVPESVGEAAGREDPHLAGTGATVDAGARPPGPVPRGSCTRRIQGVVATRPPWCERSSSLKTSEGVLQPSVFRGRRLSVAATAAMSRALCLLRSVPLGKY